MGERKQWRKDHPAGFSAHPVTSPDGSIDLKRWKCVIPGKQGTIWEGGKYNLDIYFPDDYPSVPPRCVFKPVLFHPNVYPSGTVCLSLLNPKKSEFGWRPSISVKEILLGIQHLLEAPNWADPAQVEPVVVHQKSEAAYEEHVKAFVKSYMERNRQAGKE